MWTNPYCPFSLLFSVYWQSATPAFFFLHLHSLSAIILSFKFQYPRTNSPDRSSCISLQNRSRDLKKRWTQFLFGNHFINSLPQKFILHQIYSVQIWYMNKVQFTVKSRAEMLNTSFAHTSFYNPPRWTFFRYICRGQICVNLIFRSVIMTFPLVCALTVRNIPKFKDRANWSRATF